VSVADGLNSIALLILYFTKSHRIRNPKTIDKTNPGNGAKYLLPRKSIAKQCGAMLVVSENIEDDTARIRVAEFYCFPILKILA